MQTRLGLRTIKSREDPQIKKQDVSIAKARTDGKQEAITTPSNEEDQESSTILKCSSLLEQMQEKKTTLKRRSTRLSSKRSTPSDNKQRTILEAFTSQQVSTEEIAPKRTIPEKRQASCEYPSPEKEESKKIRLHPESDNECVDENPPLTENVYATPVEEKRIRELSDSEDGEELSVRSKRLRKSAACFEDSSVDEEPDQQRSQSNEHDVVLPGKSSNGHETTKDDDYSAVEQKPWKAVIYESDQARIADECYTLKSLRKALDILLTFYAGNKRMALFHKITPVLRNSTKKNITLAHMCKILYLTPELYKLEPQVIAEYATNVETYSVELGGKWKPPLDGKSLEERETLLASKLEEYFKEHKEPNATVPEKELPKSTKVVDKKAWLQTAKIPERVREILLLQEQRKEETKKEAEQAKPEPKGSVKERRQALLERIRAKSQKK